MKELTRVRYTRTDNGFLVSKELLGVEHVITVTVDTKSMVYKLVNKQDKVLFMGEGKDLALIKKAVKESLKSYGVKFLDEVRVNKNINKGEIV